MRLMFAARAIGGMAGGVERMVIALANEMAARGHEVALFTWDRADERAFYPIAPAVAWHRLDMGDPAVAAGPLLRLRRAAAVRRIVRGFRPDVLTAFQAGTFLALRLYCAGMGIPVVVTERNAPQLYDHTSAGEKGKQAAFRAFRMARFLVVQCESYLPLHPPYLRKKLFAIPNPVYPAAEQARPDTPDGEGRFRLLSVGRLAYQKNYECLIAAFAILAPMFPQWDLVIAGDGEHREKISALMRDAAPTGRIRLLGAVTDTPAQYRASHLFCLASRWEGFPNALAEALAHGLPAVGFAECAGVNVLIEHERTGLLATGNGDPETLAQALGALMADAERRRTMGGYARVAMAQYAPEKIMKRWEDLFRRSSVRDEYPLCRFRGKSCAKF